MHYEVYIDGFKVRSTGNIDNYYDRMSVLEELFKTYPTADIVAVYKSKANTDGTDSKTNREVQG
jgi:hypothetical protein